MSYTQDPYQEERVAAAPRSNSHYAKPIWLLAGCAFFVLALVLYALLFSAPGGFPKKSFITIEKGMTLADASLLLKQKSIVRSPFWFKNLVIMKSSERGLMAGDYYFDNPTSVFDVSRRLVSGNYNLPRERVTIPEGMSVNEIATLLKERLTIFDARTFQKIARQKEGYLFPDTYFWLSNISPEEVVKEMTKNFEEKIRAMENEIKKFGKSQKDIVIMASLLEEEARTPETRRMIAGILWKRLAIGMPLQVDAVFPYIIGKNTYEVTLDDLKIDSPYNTYKYRGLPPGPISNPGLDSIQAAVTPIKSQYLYYLSDTEGEMHYAKTHTEHVINKEKYLR